jgi:sugar phosphate isomerase/epimerase
MSWNRFRQDLDGVISDHKTWNCRHAAIGGLPKEYYSRKGIDRFLEELVPVAQALASEGIDFSYHNHSHELVRFTDSDGISRTWLEMLFEQASPENLKAEIDTYWIQHGGGDPVDWVRRLSGREPLLHLKDMAITPDREQRFAPIGDGNLSWPAIISAAREGGVVWYLIELDDCYGEDPFEALARSYRFLNRFGLL